MTPTLARLRASATTGLRRLADAHVARRDARDAQMALGALLAMPAVRAAIGDDRWNYFRSTYAGLPDQAEVAA